MNQTNKQTVSVFLEQNISPDNWNPSDYFWLAEFTEMEICDMSDISSLDWRNDVASSHWFLTVWRHRGTQINVR